MFLSVVKLARAGAVVTRIPFERRIPYKSPAALRGLRDKRVRRLVRYAATRVPYYIDLFAKHGIDPESIRSAEDLPRIPLLDKEALRQDPGRFVANGDSARLLALETSGSTGSPLTIYHDLASIAANIARTEPEKEVFREIFGSRRKRQMSISYRGSAARAVQKACAQHVALRPGRNTKFVEIDTPLDRIVSEINDHRPDLISTYGSFLELLFRYVTARGIEMHRPRAVLYGADMLTPSGRELIERELAITVLSTYSAVEAFRLGFTCGHGSAFHLRSDLCHVRTVDGAGADVETGTAGEVVLTNLVNRGSILINYRMGDMGTLSEKLCPCGRTLPLLESLEGRVEDIVLLGGGHHVHPRRIWQALKPTPGLIRYQLIQDETHRFRLKLVTVDDQAYPGTAAAAIASLRALFGDAEITPEQCSEIRTATGKFRPVVRALDIESRSGAAR